MKRKDLFEDYTNIPPHVQIILDKYSDGIEDGNYSDLQDARNELEEIGYTFEYYVDGSAFGLRPIDVKLNQLEGYEEMNNPIVNDKSDVNLSNYNKDVFKSKKGEILEVYYNSDGEISFVFDSNGNLVEDLKPYGMNGVFNKDDNEYYYDPNSKKFKTGGILNESQEEQFQEWMADGNVHKFDDGYGTQDALYRNRLKTLDDLRKYFYNEFIKGTSDDYAVGGKTKKFKVEGYVYDGGKVFEQTYDNFNKAFEKAQEIEDGWSDDGTYYAVTIFKGSKKIKKIQTDRELIELYEDKLFSNLNLDAYSSKERKTINEKLKDYTFNVEVKIASYPKNISIFNKNFETIFDVFKIVQKFYEGKYYTFVNNKDLSYWYEKIEEEEQSKKQKPVKANVGLAILGASMLQQRQQQKAMQPPKRSRWEDRGLDYMRPQYVAPAPVPQPMPVQQAPMPQAPMQTPYGNIDQQQLTNALMMSNAKFELGGMPKMNDPVMLGFTHYYTIRLDYEKAKEYADNLKSMHPSWDIIVTQEDNNYYILVRNPINMGSRVYADGGTLDGKRIQFKHWSGDVKHGIILGMSRDGKAYDVQYGNGHVLVRPNEIVNVYARGGYPTGRAWSKEHYNDNDDEDYEIDPKSRNPKHRARNRKFMSGGFTPNGYVVLIFNNKPHHFSAEYINGQIEDIDLNSGDDAKDLESFINKEFNEWLESAPKEYESLYYGEYDEPAQLSKSGAIENAYGFIYEDLVQKVKEGKKPILDLDRDESNITEAFEYKKGGSIFKSFEDFGNWFLGSRKSYPTGRAWTREHYHDNDDEDYEVDPRKRKVRARNRKYMAGGNVEERYARKADDTGKGINEGYVVGDGEMYFAEKESLINWLRSRGGMENLSDDFILNEAYNLDEYYYTEWDESEIEDQGYYYTADGEEIEMNARGGYPTGRAWSKEHYNDNDDEDYEIDPKSRNPKHRARNRFDVGGGVDDYKNHLASVDVIFADPKYNYSTSVSGSITEQEAREYFVGKTFNVGSYPNENLQRVIDIKFYPKGTYKKGGELIGNQHRIDMNKNGRIDAEDFEILRNSMNGAWRNEHKHVNHSEDWETKYARKTNSSRTGYKGRKEYGTGGLSGKGSRAKNRYNKEVEAYKWFVVSDNKDVESGFEFKSDATDLAKELNEGEYKGAKWKVVSLVALKRQGIADPRENWKYKAGFGAFLLGAGMGAVLGNEVAKSGASATASKLKSKAKGIKRKITDDYADFKKASKKKS